MAVWMYNDLEVYYYLVLEMNFQEWEVMMTSPIRFPWLVLPGGHQSRLFSPWLKGFRGKGAKMNSPIEPLIGLPALGGCLVHHLYPIYKMKPKDGSIGDLKLFIYQYPRNWDRGDEL